MRVALVDDNKNDLTLLHEYISEQTAHSCQIDTFSSGESFLSCWQMGAYDLVVLDIFIWGNDRIGGSEKASAKQTKRDIVPGTYNELVRESYDQRFILSLCKPLSG